MQEILSIVQTTLFMEDIKSRKAYKDGVKRIQKKLKNAKSQEEIKYILENEADFSANFKL